MSDIMSSMVLLFAISTHGLILRNACQEYANFSVTKKDEILQGSVIDTLLVKTYAQCKHACIDHRQCKSFNREDKKVGQCQLNSKTTEDKNDGACLTSKRGWSFSSTNYSEPNIGKICQKFKPCGQGILCTDICACPGYQCKINCTRKDETGMHCNKRVWSSCQEAQENGLNISGVYQINPDGKGCNFFVYCEMNTNEHQSWTIIQRREDDSVAFNRGWEDYKNGFGNMEGNLWLGLDKIYRLTNTRVALLGIDLKHADMNKKIHLEYTTFRIGNENSNYQLFLAGPFSGYNAAMSMQNGEPFSTYDKINTHVAPWVINVGHGWWYDADLTATFLNANYTNKENKNFQITWYDLKGVIDGKITYAQMKIRFP